MLYQRPGNSAPLAAGVIPQLASWDRAGSPGQRRLAGWLHEVDVLAARANPAPGPLAVELTVALPAGAPVDSGGRDLDNYLLPVVQRLDPTRVVAAFARKGRGPSALAIATAVPAQDRAEPDHIATLTSSAEQVAWKQALHDGLSRVRQVRPGPLWLTIAITTGPGRVWTNLWKPLIDSLGPVLGEHPNRPFHPHDDRIVDLGLHHHVDPRLGHTVTLHLWWAAAPPA